jgi:DNA-binding NtrC family response regulator
MTLEPSQVSETLLQSELFGVERGAFTNALPRKGVLEMADGGTLFIDELQNMQEGMQQALLNVIDGQPFRKVGDAREKKVDIRFIFASNVDPKMLVNKEGLRGDFYSRIAMHILELPTLRDRLEDIEHLAQGFINEFYTDNLPGKTPPTLTEQAVAKLQQAEWPYNVRNLRNSIRRALIRVGDKPVLDAGDLAIEDKPIASPLERDDIRHILEVAPRAGSQRDVFKYLLEQMPEAVSYERLHHVIGEQITPESSASNNLMTIISRLRGRLQARGFDIIQDAARKGYKLVKVA